LDRTPFVRGGKRSIFRKQWSGSTWRSWPKQAPQKNYLCLKEFDTIGCPLMLYPNMPIIV
jgi:hypothetical protein